jgi:hypothetical protein
MNKIALFLAVALAAFGIAGSQESEWQARYDKLIGNLNRGDLEPWKACFARQFVLISPDGSKKSRMRFFRDVEKDLAGTKGFEGKAWIKKVTPHRGSVDVAFDFKATVKTSDGKVMIHEVGVDTWQKISGKWKMVKTVDKQMTMSQT